MLQAKKFGRLLAMALVPALLMGSLTISASAESSDNRFTFSDSAISVSGSGDGYEISGTELKITQSGTYTLTGSCSQGSVTVKKEVTDVTLILENLTLSASDTAPITCNKSSSVTIQTVGANTLADKEDPEDTSDTFEGAAIKVKSNASLTLTGTGLLNIEAPCKNGIKGASTAAITVSSGTLNIDAAQDALSCDGSVTIKDGTLSLTAENNGLKAEPDETDTESAGTVSISGGKMTIVSGGDGVQATGGLTISGGTLDITTSGGYQADLAEDTSAKGLKSDKAITISGGTCTLNCADDAIHTNGDATLSGGTYEISTGDDAIHADGALTLGVKDASTGPDVTVNSCYEGLEGTTITLYAGTGHIISSDDGINAANREDKTADIRISCYGGSWTISAGGDGLDSNRDVQLYGGTIEIYSSGNADSALDYDGSCTYQGGTLLAVGMSGMAQAPSSGVSVSFGTTGKGMMGGFGGGPWPDDFDFDPSQKPDNFNPPSASDAAASAANSGTAQKPEPPDASGDAGDKFTRPDKTQSDPSSDGSQPQAPGQFQPDDAFGDDVSAVSISQGSKLEIRDSSGSTLYSATSLTKATSVIFASEDLTEGETYTLYVDDVEVVSAEAAAGSNQQAGGRFPSDITAAGQNPGFAADLPFSDISTDSWYYDAVRYVYGKGLMLGTNDSLFSPTTATTRGMAVTLLYRLDGSPAVSNDSCFSDVSAGSYCEDAVKWAAEKQIVTGYDSGKFGPDDQITREQLASILYRYACYKGYDVSQTGDLTSFTDGQNVSSYAKTALSWANGTQLITGTNAQTLNAAGTADRSQFAIILMRFCENIAK